MTKKLTWWFRVVGGFNVFLAVMNLAMFAVSRDTIANSLPYAKSTDVTDAFIDAWFTFVMDLAVMGVFLLWASRRPRENVNLLWLVAALELFHGIVGDLFLIARGYEAAGYLAFMVVHLAIIGSAVALARKASAEPEEVVGVVTGQVLTPA